MKLTSKFMGSLLVLSLSTTCFVSPVFANTTIDTSSVSETHLSLQSKTSTDMVILDGYHLSKPGERVRRSIEHDVLLRDSDGDADGYFSTSDPIIRIYIDNRSGNSAVEFTLYKDGNSFHGSQQWPKVEIPKGRDKTIELSSGAGDYSYYVCATDGSALDTGIRVRGMRN